MALPTANRHFAFEAETDWLKLPDGLTVHEVPGVSVAPDGLVYLITRNTANPVVVVSPDGEFIRTFGAGSFTSRTHAINAADDGYIYCADDGAHTITKWTPVGDLIMTIGTPGIPSPRFSGRPFNRPTDMVVTADGTIYVSDGYGNARIHRYSPSGEHQMSWGAPGIDPGQFMLPHNLGLDGDRLYVADREAHRVQVFSLDGDLLDVWNNIHRPCALSVGPDRNVYVGELNGAGHLEDAPGMGHRVSVLDPRGRLLARFGDPIEGEAPGQFIAPHGIAVNVQGDVFVGEVAFTIRGQWMTPPGELKAFNRLRRLG